MKILFHPDQPGSRYAYPTKYIDGDAEAYRRYEMMASLLTPIRHEVVGEIVVELFLDRAGYLLRRSFTDGAYSHLVEFFEEEKDESAALFNTWVQEAAANDYSVRVRMYPPGHEQAKHQPSHEDPAVAALIDFGWLGQRDVTVEDLEGAVALIDKARDEDANTWP